MKEIFRNKKWIAFFLAFILVVTVGVNSSDAFLWAVGDVEETASEESGTQAHSSDEEGGEGAPEAETGGENTEFAGEAGVTSGNQFITAEQKDFGTSDGQQASGDGQASDGQQPGDPSTGQPSDGQQPGDPSTGQPSDGQQPGDPSTGQPSDGQQTGDPSAQPGNNGGTVEGTVVITPDTVDGTTAPGEADGTNTSGAADETNTPGAADGTVTEDGLPVVSDKVANGALDGVPGMEEEIDPDKLLMTVEEEELYSYQILYFYGKEGDAHENYIQDTGSAEEGELELEAVIPVPVTVGSEKEYDGQVYVCSEITGTEKITEKDNVVNVYYTLKSVEETKEVEVSVKYVDQLNNTVSKPDGAPDKMTIGIGAVSKPANGPEYTYVGVKYGDSYIKEIQAERDEDGKTHFYVVPEKSDITRMAVEGDDTLKIELIYSVQKSFGVTYIVKVDRNEYGPDSTEAQRAVALQGKTEMGEGESFNFSAKAKYGYDITNVYAMAGGNSVGLSQNNGVYSVNAGNVTGDIVVTVEVEKRSGEADIGCEAGKGPNTSFGYNRGTDYAQWYIDQGGDSNKPLFATKYEQGRNIEFDVVGNGYWEEKHGHGDLKTTKVLNKFWVTLSYEGKEETLSLIPTRDLNSSTELFFSEEFGKTKVRLTVVEDQVEFWNTTSPKYHVSIEGPEGIGVYGHVRIESNYKNTGSSEIWVKEFSGIKKVWVTSSYFNEKNAVLVEEGKTQTSAKFYERATAWDNGTQPSNEACWVYFNVEDGFSIANDDISATWGGTEDISGILGNLESGEDKGYDFKFLIPANPHNGTYYDDIRLNIIAKPLVKKYTVKYNYNGGVESEVVDTNNGNGYKSGDTFSVSDKKGKLPVREGFVFTGWKLEGSNPAQIYNANDVFSINAENEKYAVPGNDGKYQYTFTAQWTKLNEVSDLPFIVNVYFPDAEGKYTQPNVSLMEYGTKGKEAQVLRIRLQDKLKEYEESLPDDWESYDRFTKNTEWKKIINDSSVVFDIYFTKSVTYKVEHYKEQVSGGYAETPDDIDTLTGEVGEKVTAEAKTGGTYAGFTWDQAAEGTVLEGILTGGETPVLKLYYKRNMPTVKYEYTGMVPAGAEEKLPDVEDHKYGETVTVKPDVAVQGYKFSGWKTESEGVVLADGQFTMPANDVVFKGYFTKIPTSYQIITYYKGAKGEILEDLTEAGEVVSTALVGDNVPYESAVSREGKTKNGSHYALDRVELEENGSIRTLGELTITGGTAGFTDPLKAVEVTEDRRVIKIYYALDVNGPEEPEEGSKESPDDIPDYLEHSVTYDGNGGYTVPEAGETTGKASYQDARIYPEGATVTMLPNRFEKKTETGVSEFAGWLDETVLKQPGDLFTMGSEDVTLPAQWKSLRVTKNFTQKTDENGDTKGYDAGDLIPFTIEVENIGDVELTNVVVEENLADAEIIKDDTGKYTVSDGKAVISSLSTKGDGSKVTVKAQYRVKETDLRKVEGESRFTNKATASAGEAKDTGESPEVPMVSEEGNILVTKTINQEKSKANGKEDGKFTAGDTVYFTVIVENTGEKTLRNIELSDSIEGARFTVDGNPDGAETITIDTLAPGKANAETFEVFYKIKETDLKKGEFTNIVTAEVEGKDFTGESERVEVEKQRPEFSVEKEIASVNSTAVGKNEEVNVKVNDMIHYTVTVKNTGNMILKDVLVEDTINAAGTVTFDRAVNGKNETVTTTEETISGKKIRKINSLPAGETVTLHYSYTVQKEDAGTAGGEQAGKTIINRAKVTGNTTDQNDPVPTPKEDETEPATVEDKYILTIHYVYAGTDNKAAEDTVGEYLKGEHYEISSPVIEGYSSDRPVVNGTMPGQKTEITVTYTARIDLKYAVRYHYSDDGKNEIAGSPVTVSEPPVAFGESFFTESTDVEGHKTRMVEENSETKTINYMLDTREGKGVQYGASRGIVSANEDNNKVDVYYVLDSNSNNIPDYREHRVIYQLNGGVLEDRADGKESGADVIEGPYEEGTPQTTNAAIVPVKTTERSNQKFEFAGWTTDAAVEIDGNGNFTMPAGDLYLTAQWRGMTVEKTVTSTPAEDGRYQLNENITFQIVVTNSGTVDLHDVIVTDGKTEAKITGVTGVDSDGYENMNGNSVTIKRLAAGASVTVTAEYAVASTDIEDANDQTKGFTNTATAKPKDETITVEDTTPKIPTEGVDKQLTVVKSIRKNGDGNPAGATGVDEDGNRFFKVGETVTFDIIVTNSGNQALENIAVSDVMQDVAIRDGNSVKEFLKKLFASALMKTTGESAPKSGVSKTITSLEPGASETFTVTYKIKDSDIGRDFVNVATAKAEDGTENWDSSEQVPVEQPDRKAAITKSYKGKASGDGVKYKPGDTIQYEITVENTGNVALENFIVKDVMTATDGNTEVDLSDQIMADGITTGGGETYGDGVTWDPKAKQFKIDQIEAHESVKILYKYEVQPEDVGKKIQNAAVGVIDGKDTPKAKPDKDPEVEKRSLKVEKVVLDSAGDPMTQEELENAEFGVGTLRFRVTVTNTGNVTLNGVKVTDVMRAENAEGATGAREAELVKGNDTFDLEAGKSEVLEYTYTITEADLGCKLYNVATASGDGAPEPEKPGEAGPVKIEEEDPGVSVVKTVTSVPADANGMYKDGEAIRYEIIVTNEGNTTLTDVKVKDTMTGAAGSISEVAGADWDEQEKCFKIDSIAVGGNATITYSYVVQPADAGKEIGNEAVMEDEDIPNKEEPENPDPVTVEKRNLEVEKTVVNQPEDGDAYQAGEEILFAVTVENTGNVNLTGITLTDKMIGTGTEAVAVNVTRDENGALSTDADGKIVTTPVAGGHGAFDLEAGKSTVLYYSYTVQEDDLKVAGAAAIKNTVRAEASDGTTGTDETGDLDIGEKRPDYTVRKEITSIGTAEGGRYRAGDTITYKITVENTGNVELTDVTVKDRMEGAAGSIDNIAGADWDDETGCFTIAESIAVDESREITYDYVVQPGDAGKTIRNAVMKGSEENPDPDNGDAVKEVEVERKGLRVTKEVANAPANGTGFVAGEGILFRVTVTNTGNVSLSDIRIADDMQNALGEAEAVRVDENGAITPLEGNHRITSLAAGTSTVVYYSYTVQEGDIGKTDIRNKVTAVSTGETPGGDPAEDDPTGEDTTGELPIDGLYTLTVRYEYTGDGTGAAESYTANLPAGKEYLVNSPVIDGYNSSAAFVAGKMPGRNLELVIYYTAAGTSNSGGGGGGNPDPSTPPTPQASLTGTDSVILDTIIPVVPTPGGAVPVIVPTDAGLTEIGDEEVPLQGALVDEDDDGNVIITPITDEEVPLAGGIFDDRCCILHFLLMLAAFILYTWYTNDMKKRQGRLAQLTDELAQEKLKRQSGV